MQTSLLAGRAGLSRRIRNPHVQKTGLALAGFDEYLKPGRVLVLGESEVRYLQSLPPSSRTGALDRALGHDIPCILVTGDLAPPRELLDAADAHAVPLLCTPMTTPLAIARLGALLDDVLAVRQTIHGVLLDVLGLGILIVGESGIGKSECALDLVARGHRLVADDTVEVRRRSESSVIGACPALTRHHMEIRGLGLINVRDLFGVAATRAAKRVELVVQLERWDPGREYDRLGLDERTYDLLGAAIPLLSMPVAPGRNVAILVEVAARNQLLRARGLNAARALAERLERQLDDASDLEDDEGSEPADDD
ncbi:MAG: HPr(Ser) kinase/phosphatase [Acidimicrobiia bacterium]|nr:HPr(Ser) kinase/phosphatase [Acidimicrobiia bacterium]